MSLKRKYKAISMRCALCALSILLLFALPARSQNASPLGGVGSLQFFDNNGALLTAGVVYLYQAGTSTQATVYVDSTGTTTQPNPVTFGSGARAGIWLANGTFVKVVLCTQNDGAFCSAGDILFTADQVPIGSSGGGGGGSPFTGIFISSTASPATSGTLRLASGDSICWRNAAGSANLCFSKNSNDILSWAGGSFQLPEIAAPTCGLAGNDCFWADNTAHRFKSISNGGTAAQFVLSGNDIGTTDQVLGIHWGATQQTFGSTAATTGQVIEFNGTNLVPINTTPNSSFTTSPALIFTTIQSGATSFSATMVTAPASAATYRFSGHLHVITVGASCTGNTNVAVTVTFTDTADGGVLTTETMPVEVNASVTGSFIIVNNGALGNLTHMVGRTFRSASGANISYNVNITPGTGCSPAPKTEFDPILEQLTAN